MGGLVEQFKAVTMPCCDGLESGKTGVTGNGYEIIDLITG
jgi:hypothetical protein